jgi:sugar O-acyltransferase (sialic acid O-acetyltransferase NeuD family)
MQRIAIIGAGGFAREVEWLIRDLNRVTPQFQFMGYLVSDLSLVRETDSKEYLLGDFGWLEGKHDVDALVFGIASPQVKLRLAAELEQRFPQLQWPSLIHPTVQYDKESARIGRGIVMCANTVGTVNIDVDDYAMVNLLCTIGHETRVGRCAVVNPSVNLSGGVKIGEGAFVGVGAKVLQYVTVGDHATVGAGSVVMKDVEPYSSVIGVPARPLPVHRAANNETLQSPPVKTN